jgi:hypothetical protein
MSGKPQGRKPREHAETVSGGEELWGFEQRDAVRRFDRGVNATAITVRREVSGRRDADIYRGGIQEPSWDAAVTMGVCAGVIE